MLALNISTSLRGELDGRPSDVRSCAERWWAISDSTLAGYADQIMAVGGNVVAGVFNVRGWRRDPAAGDKVVFDLVEASEWQWLVGQDSPVTWRKSQANPVRKVGTVITSELRARQPHHAGASRGWSLDVDPDGKTATVHAPGPVMVTDIGNSHARLAVAA
jgi:hypothetical protein